VRPSAPLAWNRMRCTPAEAGLSANVSSSSCPLTSPNRHQTTGNHVAIPAARAHSFVLRRIRDSDELKLEHAVAPQKRAVPRL